MHHHTKRSEKNQELSFLGTLVKLQRVTTSFIVSVCPSVYAEQLGFHRKDFHEILYQSIFPKSVKTIQVSLNCNKNNRYFT